ncbi:inclusion body family protein [Chryseobacterium sp.]|uniref:inclusion body family protein n=1 Tax=Chryseobacterium sp. TaxID=1871047 RepID=UPI0025BDDC31|nr:inclusion body family protein [Chryseobacterium sp.]MBV8326829.1 inclusion body family protein [Chryseobacterium sp.]
MDTHTEQLSATNQLIDVMIVIDTDYVIDYIKNSPYTPSTDINTPVPLDHLNKYMIVPSTNAISGQATGDLHFRAKNGDIIRFRGTSLYQNSDAAVIVHNVTLLKAPDVFGGNPLYCMSVDRKQAVAADNTTQHGVPPLSKSITFSSLDVEVKDTGTGSYYIHFALYTLSSGDKQTLYSYCCWDPTITVV